MRLPLHIPALLAIVLGLITVSGVSAHVREPQQEYGHPTVARLSWGQSSDSQTAHLGVPPQERTPANDGHEEEDGGQAATSDILEMALLTTAAFLGAALVLSMLYIVRMKIIGFWFHRPPPPGSEGASHH